MTLTDRSEAEYLKRYEPDDDGLRFQPLLYQGNYHGMEPIPDGKYKGFTIAKWLPDLIFEYYRLSGRHERTGRPYIDTLNRLGLEEFKQWSQLD